MKNIYYFFFKIKVIEEVYKRYNGNWKDIANYLYRMDFNPASFAIAFHRYEKMKTIKGKGEVGTSSNLGTQPNE